MELQVINLEYLKFITIIILMIKELKQLIRFIAKTINFR